MWPGTNVKFSGNLPSHFVTYDHDANWTQSVEKLLGWFTHKESPANFVMAYFDQPDFVGHLKGPFSKEYHQEVKRADMLVGYLVSRLKELNIFDDLNMIVLSDHGMAEITLPRVIKLDNFLDRTSYDMYGASPLWTIQPKAGHEQAVYQVLLNASHQNHFTVYQKQDIPIEYFYTNNRRILDLVVVADDGYDIVSGLDQIGDEKGEKAWGNHGYNNSLESMRPLFIASGPAFRKGLKFEEEFENTNLYPLFCYVLELLPLKNFPSNGTLAALSPILLPITRESPAANWFPIVFIFSLGFFLICCGGLGLVCIAGFGSKKRSVELSWDPGVTEFEFAEGDGTIERPTAIVPYSRSSLSGNKFAPEEVGLLLDGEEEELL